ncbi:hypothetical protein A2U01_0013999, partial [Trifolium medium]|nr:hypothetical protein [Trifolium medium]
ICFGPTRNGLVVCAHICTVGGPTSPSLFVGAVVGGRFVLRFWFPPPRRRTQIARPKMTR